MSYNEPTYSVLLAMGHNPNRHLPEGGIPSQLVNGVHVWVMSKEAAKIRGITQRTRALCPNCGKEVAYGNLRQHMYGNRRRVPGVHRVVGRQLGCTEER